MRKMQLVVVTESKGPQPMKVMYLDKVEDMAVILKACKALYPFRKQVFGNGQEEVELVIQDMKTGFIMPYVYSESYLFTEYYDAFRKYGMA